MIDSLGLNGTFGMNRLCRAFDKSAAVKKWNQCDKSSQQLRAQKLSNKHNMLMLKNAVY